MWYIFTLMRTLFIYTFVYFLPAFLTSNPTFTKAIPLLAIAVLKADKIC